MQVPLAALGVKADDRVTITAVNGIDDYEALRAAFLANPLEGSDPESLGLVASVRTNQHKTHATKRTLVCEVDSKGDLGDFFGCGALSFDPILGAFLIVNEIEGAAALPDAPALAAAVELTADARRVFVHGAGRSGLALRMTAMRLMHLGLQVHVVGETTTPAIGEGDLLLTASGSGTTSGVVSAAETARSVGARVIGITTDPQALSSRL